jgi:hypothetical protein
MNRTQQVLAGILALQIVFIAVAFWPRTTAAVAGAPVFSNLEVDDIVALTVTDAEGNVVVLRKQDEGWVLPEADSFPADADKVVPVLEKIAGLTTSRLVTQTSSSHKRLQVAADDYVRRIDFETTNGDQHTLFLGSTPQYGAMHFRVDGQDETYLTSDFSTYDTRAESAAWIDTSYVKVDEASVKKVTLQNANGSFTFTRDEGEDWTMAGLHSGETLSQTQVDSLVRRAASVTMDSPLGKEQKPEYGMEQPGAVVRLETADSTVTLRVGAQDPEDQSYVVISSESPYYVRVASYAVQDLVEKTRDGFLELPPTPTPEAQTESTE